MTAFFNHFTYDFRTGLRNRSLMLLNYLFPLFFYAMMGGVMGNINPLFKEYMIPSMMVFAVLSATVLAMPGPVVLARENGVFRSYKINGVPSLNIVIIPILGTMLHVTLCAAIIYLTAQPFFGAGMPLAGRELQFWLVFLVLAFTLSSAGMLIGVIAPNERATVLLGQAIYLPSILLGGLMIPLQTLPTNVQPASLFFPATYAMEAFRGLSMGLPVTISPVLALITLLASGILCLLLAAYLFNWDSRNTGSRRPRALALLALVPYILTALAHLF